MPAVRSIAGPIAQPATPAPASIGAPRMVIACRPEGFAAPGAPASDSIGSLMFGPFSRDIIADFRLDNRRRLPD